MKFLLTSISLAFALLITAEAQDCSVAPVFSSDMILQREMPIPIWGKAENGTVINVTFNDQKQTSTAQDGSWKVVFPPMPTSAQPRTMVIEATGRDGGRYDNILVGDVWLASGQSNMEMQLSGASGGKEAIAKSANWHAFRLAQLDCWQNIPNSHMVVTIDLSKEPTNHPIHPKTKAPVGHRIAQ